MPVVDPCGEASVRMVTSPCPSLRPRSIEVPGHVVTGTPTALGGHHASLPLAAAPTSDAPLEVLVHWPDGLATRLATRVRAVDDGGVTHVEVVGVGGAWKPWLEWLGHCADAGPRGW